LFEAVQAAFEQALAYEERQQAGLEASVI